MPIETKNQISNKANQNAKFTPIEAIERLSSLEAKKSLINQGIKTGHNKEDIDMTAAALFLQNYLNYLEK